MYAKAAPQLPALYTATTPTVRDGRALAFDSQRNKGGGAYPSRVVMGNNDGNTATMAMAPIRRPSKTNPNAAAAMAVVPVNGQVPVGSIQLHNMNNRHAVVPPDGRPHMAPNGTIASPRDTRATHDGPPTNSYLKGNGVVASGAMAPQQKGPSAAVKALPVLQQANGRPMGEAGAHTARPPMGPPPPMQQRPPRRQLPTGPPQPMTGHPRPPQPPPPQQQQRSHSTPGPMLHGPPQQPMRTGSTGGPAQRGQRPVVAPVARGPQPTSVEPTRTRDGRRIKPQPTADAAARRVGSADKSSEGNKLRTGPPKGEVMKMTKPQEIKTTVKNDESWVKGLTYSTFIDSPVMSFRQNGGGQHYQRQRCNGRARRRSDGSSRSEGKGTSKFVETLRNLFK